MAARPTAIRHLGDLPLDRRRAPYDGLDNERTAAVQLAQFVAELQAIEVSEHAPRGGRRPLRELDDVTREALAASEGVIDVAAAMAAWERALGAPPWDGAPVWIHTDVLRPNVLVRDGRLHAVIDFGVGVGDPAADMVPAWAMFERPGEGDVPRPTRRRRRHLGARPRLRAAPGGADHPYYAESNRDFVAHAQRTVEQLHLR